MQGFAPHYDDVDVFIVHTAGHKRWRIYKPLPVAILPATSSPDFDERQDEIGAPILDVVLKPGDLLYLPRGTIHQAEALPGRAALHVTISANQRKTWADFLAAAALVRHAPWLCTSPCSWLMAYVVTSVCLCTLAMRHCGHMYADQLIACSALAGARGHMPCAAQGWLHYTIALNNARAALC